jgi:hypothetical protein
MLSFKRERERKKKEERAIVQKLRHELRKIEVF